jgi:hypothetical protein
MQVVTTKETTHIREPVVAAPVRQDKMPLCQKAGMAALEQRFQFLEHQQHMQEVVAEVPVQLQSVAVVAVEAETEH